MRIIIPHMVYVACGSYIVKYVKLVCQYDEKMPLQVWFSHNRTSLDKERVVGMLQKLEDDIGSSVCQMQLCQ